MNDSLEPNRRYNINIRTRGPLLPFQNIGLLSRGDNSNTNDVLTLKGRPTYRGSSRWEYFVNMKDSLNEVTKIDIQKEGKELFVGDEIKIPVLNGTYKLIQLYEYDKPRYIPYI